MLTCQTEKLMYGFATEMNFDLIVQGKKSARDKTLIKLLKSPSLMDSASSVSKTKFLSSDLDEFFERIKLLLQEEHAGKKSNVNNEGITAIVDKLLEYKCISKKEHK